MSLCSLKGERVTSRDDTGAVVSEREIEEIRGDSSRKHREIVVLARLRPSPARTRACITRRSVQTRAHIYAPPFVAENHAQLSVVKSSAARGEKGALEKGSLGVNTATGGCSCAAPSARIQWRNSRTGSRTLQNIYVFSRAF